MKYLVLVLLMLPLSFSESLHSEKEILSKIEKLKFEETGPGDYIFKAGMFMFELEVGAKIIGAKAGNNLFVKQISKKTGLKVTDAKKFLKSKKHFFYLLGLMVERPTPGGLRKAAKNAIYYSNENYLYALKKGIPEDDAHLISAKEHLNSALRKYSSYTGYIDAVSLSYTSYTPEGFDKIVEDALSAVKEIKAALKENTRRKEKIVIK